MDLLQHSKAGRVSHALLCFFCPYTAIIQERRPLPGPWYILMLLYIVVFLVAALGSFVQSFSGIGAAVLLMLEYQHQQHSRTNAGKGLHERA